MKSVVSSTMRAAAAVLLFLALAGQQQQSLVVVVSAAASSSSSISQQQQVVQTQQQHPQQLPRDLLDHTEYFMKTLRISVKEATNVCGIAFQAFTLFHDMNSNTMDPDPDPTIMAYDFIDLLRHYANLFPATCSAAEEHHFRLALDTFATCSSFDLEGVLETFSDAIIGSIMDCVVSIVPLLQQQTTTTNLLSDLVLPETCINAFLGKNPLGDAIRNTILYPDKILSCFTVLSQSIPSCTLEDWPVPLVGPILTQTSCFIGEFKTFWKHLSEHNLDMLDICLPENVETEEVKDSDTGIAPPPTITNCDDYCYNFMGTEVMLNIPFSDISQHLAKKHGLDDVITRFEAFATICLPNPWQGWSYDSNDYNDVSVKLYPDPSVTADADSPSFDKNTDIEQEEDQSSAASSSSENQDNDSNGQDRFAIGLASGFLTGLFAAGIMWVIASCCRYQKTMRNRKQQQEQDPKIMSIYDTSHWEYDDTGSSHGDDDNDSDSGDDNLYAKPTWSKSFGGQDHGSFL